MLQRCKLHKPETVFLILALFFGIGMVFLIPVGAGFDETTHLARAWELSGGTFIPNQSLAQGPNLPFAFVEVSYRNRFFNTPVEADYWERNASKRIDWANFIGHQTRAVYFPLMYLPQAFILGLFGRVLDTPVVWSYLLSRLFNALLYVALGYFTIRIAPFGKWLMVVMALAPMAIFQAGTISSDPFSNGVSLLFTGWILALAWRGTPLSWKQVAVTLGLVGLLLAGKPGTAFLLVLLVLLPWRMLHARKTIVLLAGTLVLFAFEAVGWNLLIYQDFYTNVPGYGASAQMRYIAGHFGEFLGTFLNDFKVHGWTYVHDWIAVYAYNTGRVPDIVYPLYGLLVVGAIAFEPSPVSSADPVDVQARWNRIRVGLLVTFVFGYLFTVIGMYLTTNRTGSPFIEGVQGRYFLIVFPLLFLALIGLWPGLSERLAKFGSRRLPLALGAGLALVLAFYAAGLYLTYYVTCGTSYFTPGLCYQPPYRNWDPNSNFSPPVINEVKLSQSFTAVCSPMESVRVWTGQPGASAQQTTLTLRDALSGDVLSSEPFDNQSVKPNTWLEMRFPAITNSIGQQFIIEINSSGADGQGALVFGQSQRREYSSGEYLMNSQPQEADLLFQYGCDFP